MQPDDKVRITRGIKRGWTGSIKRAAENIPGFFWVSLDDTETAELFNGNQLKPVPKTGIMLRLIDVGRKKVSKTLVVKDWPQIDRELSKHINSTVINLNPIDTDGSYKITIGAGLEAGQIKVLDLAAA